MDFKEIFGCFVEKNPNLKVLSVASCDPGGKPNSASKMLVDVAVPNKIYFLDYKFTQSYSNIHVNPQLSISFMDDASFTGYRLTGTCEILDSGPEYDAVKTSWEKRLISYEADRIIRRIQGYYSTKESENALPRDFVIVKFTAKEASVVKPDRVFRARQHEGIQDDNTKGEKP